MNFDVRTIDWELFKVRTAVTVQLRIKVRIDAALEEWIFGEIDPTDNVTRLELVLLADILGDPRDTYHNLLSLGEVVRWIGIKLHLS